MRKVIYSSMFVVMTLLLVSPLFAQTHDYLPGDVNMLMGAWPPSVTVADLPYLANYFRFNTSGCYFLESGAPEPFDTLFFAPADVNGDCAVNSADITYLVEHFKGLNSLMFCSQYNPTWVSSEDVPSSPPAGWPNCLSKPNTYTEPFVNAPDPDILFWIGNIDSSPISADLNSIIGVNIYVETDIDAYGSSLNFTLGADNQYLEDFYTHSLSSFYYPLTEWDVAAFSNRFDSPPNQPGWISCSLFGAANLDSGESPWLHTLVPEAIATFAILTTNDPAAYGQIAECLSIGGHPFQTPLEVSDTSGTATYPIAVSISAVNFGSSNGSISGIVTTPGGVGIADVIINTAGPSIADTTSNNDGEFQFQNLFPGVYDIHFSHPGYYDTSLTGVEVEAGSITPVEMVMTPIFVESGWVYNRPRSFSLSANLNSTVWQRMQLINYDTDFSVRIDSIKASESWIDINNWTGVEIPANDSTSIQVTFDMSSYPAELYKGEIEIWHSGSDSLNTVACIVQVLNRPSIGAIITTETDTYDFQVQPDVEGEINIRINNTGDLPLDISGTSNSQPWLSPIINSGSVGTVEPFDLVFEINTTGYAGAVLNDDIVINSNAVNDPALIVHLNLEVLPDDITGTNSYGDVNYDGWCNWADLWYLQDYLMGTGPAPCMPAADMNGNGPVDTIDLVYLVAYLSGIGSAPVNACPIADNPPMHEINLQTQLDQYFSGHRGEWINIPLYIENDSYFRGQTSFDIQTGVIDQVIAEDVTGLGFEAIGTITDNAGRSVDIINIADTLGPSGTVSFATPTQLYNVRLHIKDDAPVGRYQLMPSSPDAEQGPTIYIGDDNSSMHAPMFAGSYITVRPRVSLNGIINLPEVGLVNQPRSFPVSLAITSDASVVARMLIYIISEASGDTVYTDSIYHSLSVGSQVYYFNADWDVSTPGAYRVGARILSDYDEPDDNRVSQTIYMTDFVQNGFPEPEGFGEEGFFGFSVNDTKDTSITLPTGFKSENTDSTIPYWNTYNGWSYNPEDNKCSYLPGYNYPGPHNDWLVFGPMATVQARYPVIRFRETATHWGGTSGATHEFYILHSSDFEVSAADTLEPILVHTPSNHFIAPTTWLPVEIHLADSLIYEDSIFFAWRYKGEEKQQKSRFDVWQVDYIEWFNNPSVTFDYVCGDANMYAGHWPPAVQGSDVTYMVNYLRGSSKPCLIDTAYAPADVNGDCKVIGADVSVLVNYFRGMATLVPCPDFMPAWPPLPDSQPVDWPICVPIPDSLNGREMPEAVRYK